MRAPAVLALVAVLAGCADPAAPGAVVEPWLPACIAEGAPLSSGGCAAVLGPAELRDREPSVAAHPTDPETVLVTWRQGEFSQGPRIFAAVTHDGGASWSVARLENRGRDVQTPVGSGTYAYDSIAAYGSDGRAYVLYGGDRTAAAGNAAALDRLTLAVSTDGAAWSYVTVYEPPTRTAAPDYPDLAVSPDGKRLVVVAQNYAQAGVTVVPEGIWAWRSGDGGATWSAPVVAIPNAPLRQHYLPRVSFGENGLVLLTTNMNGAAYVTVSRDGGETFGAPTRVLAYESGDGTGINDPSATWPGGAALVYADGTRVLGFRASDDAPTWGDAVDLWTAPAPVQVLSATADAIGTVVAFVRHGTDDDFGVDLVRWRADGSIEHAPLHRAAVPGAWVVGDDYGAVTVGADGDAWAAWALPDEDGTNEDIHVARVPGGGAE